jgi:hypothetical protein
MQLTCQSAKKFTEDETLDTYLFLLCFLNQKKTDQTNPVAILGDGVSKQAPFGGSRRRRPVLRDVKRELSLNLLSQKKSAPKCAFEIHL